MPGTRHGIYIEFIGDELKYVRSAENVMSTNTRLGSSFKQVAVDATKSAETQVKTALAANAALKEQAINLRAIAATSTGEKQAAALQLASNAEAQLARNMGVTTTAAATMSARTREAERDLNKLGRGAVAGSGLFASLGRSLAFASTGFIAVAGGATLLRRSVDAAIELAATQRQVDQQLRTSGKTWGQYGDRIDQVLLKESHLAGFTHQDLLQAFGYLVRVSGNVQTSLRLTSVAADVARGRHIKLSAASLALGKALGGSITALRRLGIVVPKDVKGMDALNYVAAKFAGQAKAGATIGDRFNATLVDSEEIIGTALLPSITRLLTTFGNWLARMNESGRLQKDVNGIMREAGDVAHVVGEAIGTLDKITGSFANTLKLIVEIKFAMRIASWIGYLGKLTAGWTAVEGAAAGAAVAEERALAVGGIGGAAGGAAAGAAGVKALGAGGLLSLFLKGKRPVQGARFVAGTTAETTIDTAVLGPVTRAEAGVARLRASLLGLGALTIAPIVIPIIANYEDRFNQATRGSFFGRHFSFFTTSLLHPIRSLDAALKNTGAMPLSDALELQKKLLTGEGFRRAMEDINREAAAKERAALIAELKASAPYLFGRHPAFVPQAFQPGGTLGRATRGTAGVPSPYPFGVPPIAVYTQYQEPYTLQAAGLKAQLTKTLADDTAVAKKIIANIKHLIDIGHFVPGTKGYLSALQAWVAAQQQLTSAEAEAAAKRQAAAQRAKEIASTFSTSVDLQIAQVQAEMTKGTADDVKVLHQIIAQARKALASGKKNKQGRLAALEVILQAQQALEGLRQQTVDTYSLPQRLQLGLLRAQAFGGDQRKWLLKMKAAALKAYKAARGNVEKQMAILQTIIDVNNQLNSGLSDAQAALGLFKQANLKKLTAGLTAADRIKMLARLSQLGPGGTVPGTGTGAAGYAINPDTDRPIVIHHTTKLDGKTVAKSTTKHQQRRRKRNPRQRRGPNAGAAAA